MAAGDTLRLQQLLAQLNYLPVGFSPSGPAPARADLAEDQPGTFSWRWPGLPTELTSQWTQGAENEITKAAVEAFETQNNIGVDGIAGPTVWTNLINDVINDKPDATPYVYVLVNKVVPQNLTLWNNGVAQYVGIPINSGAPGADTTDGTYAVFEHVRYSDMKGTNVDGSTYNDPNVPYASYFNGGDALHGFIRASYGTPQSNGCVEMSYADAALVWPLTPIGTLVTVEGPNFGTAPPPTTTTTTAPAPTTTTTAPAGGPPAAVTTTTAAPAARLPGAGGDGEHAMSGLAQVGERQPFGVARARLRRGRRLRAAPLRPALRAQAAETLRHVVGLGVGAEHPLEVLAAPWARRPPARTGRPAGTTGGRGARRGCAAPSTPRRWTAWRWPR